MRTVYVFDSSSFSSFSHFVGLTAYCIKVFGISYVLNRMHAHVT